jgi:Tfp pilus assembly protein PilF
MKVFKASSRVCGRIRGCVLAGAFGLSALISLPAHADPERATAAALDAHRSIDEGDLAAAEDFAKRALSEDARNADAQVASARIAFLRDDLARAQSLLNVVIGQQPRHAAALILLVRIHEALGDPDAVTVKLRDLANTWRDDAGVQLAYGEVLLATGKYPEAVAAATRVLKLEETSVPAMKLLAGAYLGLARPVTAESVLTRILEFERDADALLMLAGIRHTEGNIIEARVLLEEAVQKVPGHVEALNSLGALYVDVRNWESSVQVLQRASALAPRLPAIWVNLGCALRGAGSFADAEAAWKQALTLDSKRAEPWFNLGVLYLENPLSGRDRLQQLTDAINAFNASKRQGAKNAADIDRYLEEARLLMKQETEKRERERKPAPTEGDGT